ncbi:unnamed protein product [Staurois parvus]|uniref:Uncharacterized protein n=1 Tax=Staurois parvus TaxID=386267 RepID=A0ABN9D059_9NEOB|nr:unnamed protein product [Staurois parvus]
MCLHSTKHTYTILKRHTVNLLIAPDVNPFLPSVISTVQGWTDNSWGPRAIEDHGPLCPCPHSKHTQKSL